MQTTQVAGPPVGSAATSVAASPLHSAQKEGSYSPVSDSFTKSVEGCGVVMWFRPLLVMVSLGRQYLGIGFLRACGRESKQSANYRWGLGLQGLAHPALAQSRASPLWSRRGLQGELVGGRGPQDSYLPSRLTDLPSQDMENKIRSTLNEIYFGKTKDIVNGLR